MSLHISADDIHLLALCAIPKLGAVTRRRLIRAFGSSEDVFRADYEALCEVDGISDTRARAVKEFGELAAESAKAIEDGTIDKAEAIKIENEAWEAVRAILAFNMLASRSVKKK